MFLSTVRNPWMRADRQRYAPPPFVDQRVFPAPACWCATHCFFIVGQWCRVVGGMFGDVSVVIVDDADAVTCWWWCCCCCCLWRSLILIRRNEDGVRWEEALEALTEATGQLDSLKTRWGSFTEACITEDPKVFFSKASPRAPFCARSCHLFCLSSSRKQARKQVGVGSRNKVHKY